MVTLGLGASVGQEENFRPALVLEPEAALKTVTLTVEIEHDIDFSGLLPATKEIGADIEPLFVNGLGQKQSEA